MNSFTAILRAALASKDQGLRKFINTQKVYQTCGSLFYRGKNHGEPLRSARRCGGFYTAFIKNGVAKLFSGRRYEVQRDGWRRLSEV